MFDEYNQLKFDRSVLDNNDLLRLTYQALRDNPAMREDYRVALQDGDDRTSSRIPTSSRWT